MTTTTDYPVTKVVLRLCDRSTLELVVDHSERERVRRLLQDIGGLIIEYIVAAWDELEAERNGGR